jgi:hypothetical protein
MQVKLKEWKSRRLSSIDQPVVEAIIDFAKLGGFRQNFFGGQGLCGLSASLQGGRTGL